MLDSSFYISGADSCHDTLVVDALAKFKEDDDDDDDGWGDFDDDDDGGGMLGKSKMSVKFKESVKGKAASPARKPHHARSQTSKNIQVKNVKFDNMLNNNLSIHLDDDDDDDWGEDWSDGSVDLASKLQLKMKMNVEEVEDDDDMFEDALESAFNDIDSDFTMTKRDEEMRLEQEIATLVGNLDPQKSVDQTLEICAKLVCSLFQCLFNMATTIHTHAALPFSR